MLLVQGLKLSFGVVYLTDDEDYDGSDRTLVPVAVYPEAAPQANGPLLLDAPLPTSSDSGQPLLSRLEPVDVEWPLEPEASPDSPILRPIDPDVSGELLSQRDRRQLVLPLTYGNMVLGLLVIDRLKSSWSRAEQRQIEQITHSLAAGCVLERRNRWLNQTLRQQHLAYEAFHQQQDAMLDTLLHQLRNPLTAVQTFGKLLMRRIQPGESNRPAAEGIVRESDRIRQLLEQFDQVMAPPPTLPAALSDPARDAGDGEALDPSAQNATRDTMTRDNAIPVTASHLLTGRALKLVRLDLGGVLTPLIQTATAIAQERRITVHYEPTSAWVVGDEIALQEVLNNLIDNAIKYTPDDGYVEVLTPATSHGGTGEQAIVIADTGPGIPDQDQRHLFERHFRGVQAEGDIPGTGLGLAIAQELTQQMQGYLTIHSPATQSELVSPCYPNAAVGTAVVIALPIGQR